MTNAFGQLIIISCSVPGTGDGSGSSEGPGENSGGSTNAPAGCAYGQIVVPCSSAAGSWSGNCYVQAASPQPPPGDPAWSGNTGGVIVQCTPYPCLTTTGTTIPDCPSITRYWAPSAPVVVVDEAAAARRAVAQLQLSPITIAMAPPPDVANPNVLIGAPAYFWATGGTPALGPLTTTVAQDGLAIALSASLTGVTFDTGDGHHLTCSRDQVATAPTDMSLRGTPECGHVWRDPGTYDLTATSTWTIAWQGPTQSGTIDHTMTSTIGVGVTDRPVSLTTGQGS